MLRKYIVFGFVAAFFWITGLQYISLIIVGLMVIKGIDILNERHVGKQQVTIKKVRSGNTQPLPFDEQ